MQSGGVLSELPVSLERLKHTPLYTSPPMREHSCVSDGPRGPVGP